MRVVLRNLRAVLRIVLVALVLPAAGPLASAAAKTSSKPVVVHPRWRVALRTAFLYAAANDRYVAIIHGSSRPLQLTLIDELSGTQQALSPPDCAGPNSLNDGSPFFGGPYLMVSCGAVMPPYTYALYNLDSGQWTSFTASSQCPCKPIAVGRYWVKLDGEGDYYLRNIQTGAVEPDPVTAGDRIFDDLGAPSGTRSLCSPLRYPRLYDPMFHVAEPGLLTFYGQFALTVEGGSPDSAAYYYQHLRRCRSRLNLVVCDYCGPGFTNQPVASSRAVMTSDGTTLKGWLLPTLWRLIVYPPAATQAPRCVADTQGVIPVALTARTIYVRAMCGNQALWAAALPMPSPRQQR